MHGSRSVYKISRKSHVYSQFVSLDDIWELSDQPPLGSKSKGNLPVYPLHLAIVYAGDRRYANLSPPAFDGGL